MSRYKTAIKIMEYWKQFITLPLNNPNPHCFITGKDEFEICHIKPKCMGGSNEVSNLILLSPLFHDLFYDTTVDFSVTDWISKCQQAHKGYREGMGATMAKYLLPIFFENHEEMALTDYEQYITGELIEYTSISYPINQHRNFAYTYTDIPIHKLEKIKTNFISKHIGAHIAHRKLHGFSGLSIWPTLDKLYKQLGYDSKKKSYIPEDGYEVVHVFENEHGERYEILKDSKFYYLRGDETSWGCVVIYTGGKDIVWGVSNLIGWFMTNELEYEEIFNYFEKIGSDLLYRPGEILKNRMEFSTEGLKKAGLPYKSCKILDMVDRYRLDSLKSQLKSA